MSDRMYVSTRKGLFTIDRDGSRKRNGSGWRITATSFLGDNVTIVYRDPRDGTVYAALAHGHFGNKLHRSRDEGHNWEEITAPEYPAPPEGAEPDICAMSGKPFPWKLDLIWSLAAGAESEPGVLWCGTLPGGLFRSADSGASWRMVRPLWDQPARKKWFGGGFDWPGIHSILVDPRDPRRLIVGVSCGGVWVTSDGGETWACRAKGMRAEYMPPEESTDPEIQDPHILVQCPEHPDDLWTQHHNGVFRTTDGCESWHEIEHMPVSSFGFAVAVHPIDPETAWFVPAIKDEQRIPVDGKVVVTRTRDGGRTFDVLREGLPQDHAYDIIYRHALDIDESGDRLAFGSSTGGLWVSENQGDSWKCVSAHLPPIYSIRFVK
ncbi:MAG: WD40/YVTN/BNR-like repeat-containing protein [Phycisphaerae bacterium]